MSNLIKMNDNNAYSQIQENKENIDILNDEKQENLVSGTTIKTINGESILGEGNIEIEGKSIDAYTKTESDAKYETIANADENFNTIGSEISKTNANVETNTKDISTNKTDIANLTSIVNDNTTGINTNKSNITTNTSEISTLYTNFNGLKTSKQDTLISGTNIKTINGNSLLGSGNITISGGGSYSLYKHYITLCLTFVDDDALTTYYKARFYFYTTDSNKITELTDIRNYLCMNQSENYVNCCPFKTGNGTSSRSYATIYSFYIEESGYINFTYNLSTSAAFDTARYTLDKSIGSPYASGWTISDNVTEVI